MQKLTTAQLYRHTNPESLPNSTNAPPFNPYFGQDRAVKAIQTALDIYTKGYHIFAAGESGLGKQTLITRLLTQRAKNEPTPPDVVFVHNFDNPRLPIAILLDNEIGQLFCNDMNKLWQIAQKKLIAKFKSPTYQNQLANIKNLSQLNEKKLIDEFNAIAKPFNVVLSSLMIDEQKTSVFTALDDKKPIDHKSSEKLHKKLIHLNFNLDDLENSTNQAIDDLHETFAKKVLTPLFDPLLEKYDKLIGNKQEKNKVITHLKNAFDDMVFNVLDIVDGESEFNTGLIPARYGVNVVVSHPKNSGSPIVFEELPTHLNLLGHIEYATELGTAYSDVSMIRAGALMRANGGYLILDALSLLEHPYAWQGLKRALQSGQIKLSSLEQMLTLTGFLSLEPMSIPLSVKVILLGQDDIYEELLTFEPEFKTLFNIRADFNHQIDRNLDNELQLCGKIAHIIDHYQLLPFDNTALAMVINALSLFCEHQNKLDLSSTKLRDLLLESHRNAINNHQTIVKDIHIKQSLANMNERNDYLKQLYWQELIGGQLLIDSQNKVVGQINALTVISYADNEFGMPTRLTASVAPKFGSGEVLDIEREVDLGGDLHAKGMLIMTSFLRSLFSGFGQMNFHASLVFEQSYGQIDGDSATLAECCALLSALANVPINQSLAITGSMNQLGVAQAIGGVCAKIEGFFDVCQSQGLTGSQGVIIPKSNCVHLMLKDEIIEAVNNGQFHIYAVDDIYQALQLLTDMPINDKNKKGEYKKGTLFYKIIKNLLAWADKDEKA